MGPENLRADDLRGVFLFDGFTDEQLEDLAAAGEEVRFVEGDVLYREGEPADFLWVLLEGRFALSRRSGREESVLAVMDRPGVWAGGFRAWSDSARYLTTGRGAGPGRMFRVAGPLLGDRVRAWFPFATHMIEGIYQTVRTMEQRSQEQAHLASLGTIAAGLAHELNNPASASVRAVEALQQECDILLGSLVSLAEASLPAEDFIAIDALRREVTPSTMSTDPIALADREDVLTRWLDDHGVDIGWRIAPVLAAAGVDVDWCERAAAVLRGPTLAPGLEWVASTLTTASLLSEVRESTGRISNLVAAAKSYSQMDRAAMQLCDITEGIESTLVMLRPELANITVVREYGDDVPRIEVSVAELNQVWTNAIDNAIDAMEGTGTLRITTRVDGDDLLVEFHDSGPPITPEVRARAFEPFFTTKDVGSGTGLGLEISRRIVVEGHGGDIALDAEPGGTVLTVRLPLGHASS